MSSQIKCYKDFNVYKKAFAVSIRLHKLSLEFPKIEQYALSDQIRRASKSVCVNIAEGYARSMQSPIEFKRFLMIALGAADEVRVWLDYCVELGYLAKADFDEIEGEYKTISKMISALHQSIDPLFKKAA
jgi:four helix bundle protein